ncbi:MAG: mechanosensitive ion channel family protein [Candidatus Nanohaloarchaea archaeon]|nr:mechanosensitive ion channel family protein [Candidatus Nanohaloarchaea archaeon]
MGALRRILNLLALTGITVLLWFAQSYYSSSGLLRSYYTVLALTVLYLVFKLFLEELVSDRISNEKSKYVFRKAMSIVYIAVFLAIAFRIWIKDPQPLLVAYGLVGAGVAFALQDVLKNFVGGIILFLRRTYQVGDRIEVEDIAGDVIDIGLFYTSLLEIQGWVEGDQATGRVVTLPNGKVLNGLIKNYTENNSFIWDEIKIPITYDSDWRKARETMLDIAREQTGKESSKAENELSEMRGLYYVSGKDTDPKVYMELTDNWVLLHLRFVADVNERRVIHNSLSRRIQEEFESLDDVEIASATFDIVGLPDMDVNVQN